MKMNLRTLGAACLMLAGLAMNGQTKSAANDENPLANLSQQPGYCSIFHNWGFIGDSMCSGELESLTAEGQRGWHDMYEYSWGQRIVAAIGGNARGDNYSQGGETTHGWIEHFWNNPKNNNKNIDAKLDPKPVYIMALGANDGNQNFEIGNIKTDVNLSDYTKNANTYAGCYAGIIQRVRSISPECYIFVVTNPRPKSEGYNDVVRGMARLFPRVYLIDIKKYAGDNYAHGSEFSKKFFTGGHLNAMGYQHAAWEYLTYINWIIEHNFADFEQSGFVNTGFKYVHSKK